MTDSFGSQGRDDDAPATEPRAGSAHPPTGQGPLPTRPATELSQLPTHPATELSPGLAHPATELAPRPSDEVGWDRTSTLPGGQPSGPQRSDTAGPGRSDAAGPGHSDGLLRRGPGVPAAGEAGRAVPTAEEVWRTGLPPGGPPGRVSAARWRRRAGSALTVALLIACAVVIYLRLHHG